MNRIFNFFRIGDMPLDTLQDQFSVERASSTVFYGVSEFYRAARLSHDAAHRCFFRLHQRFKREFGSVTPVTFLVRGD